MDRLAGAGPEKVREAPWPLGQSADSLIEYSEWSQSASNAQQRSALSIRRPEQALRSVLIFGSLAPLLLRVLHTGIHFPI